MTVREQTPPRRRQEDRSRETRRKLLDSTLHCIAKFGYGDTTIAKVAAHAGLTRGAHLHHFSTKAQLVEEATRDFGYRIFSRLQGSLDSVMEREDRVSALIDILWNDVLRSEDGKILQEILFESRRDRELARTLRSRYMQGLEINSAAVWQYFEPREDSPVEPEAILQDILLQLHGLMLTLPILGDECAEFDVARIKRFAKLCLVPRHPSSPPPSDLGSPLSSSED